MISPDLNIAPDSDSQSVEIGFDAMGKYYNLRKTETIIRKGEMHLEATKKLVLTTTQAKNLRDDLTEFLKHELHEKYK